MPKKSTIPSSRIHTPNMQFFLPLSLLYASAALAWARPSITALPMKKRSISLHDGFACGTQTPCYPGGEHHELWWDLPSAHLRDTGILRHCHSAWEFQHYRCKTNAFICHTLLRSNRDAMDRNRLFNWFQFVGTLLPFQILSWIVSSTVPAGTYVQAKGTYRNPCSRS